MRVSLARGMSPDSLPYTKGFSDAGPSMVADESLVCPRTPDPYIVRPQTRASGLPDTRISAMPMTHCIECNHPISDSAQSCPACSTKEPFGVPCELCVEPLSRSASVTVVRERDGGYEGPYRFEVVAHNTCVERYFTPPKTLQCPDCRLKLADSCVAFTALGLWSFGRLAPFVCPRCGAAVFLGAKLAACRQCTAPLYPFQVESGARGHGHVPVEAKGTANKAGCFIATAVLDGPSNGEYSRQLAVLCGFRDQVLMTSIFGRKSVHTYYRLSPPLAAYLGKSRVAKVVVRCLVVLPAARLVEALWSRMRIE